LIYDKIKGKGASFCIKKKEEKKEMKKRNRRSGRLYGLDEFLERV